MADSQRQAQDVRGKTPVSQTKKQALFRFLRDTGPAIVLLLFTAVLSLFLGATWFPPGWLSVSVTLVRFIRFTLLLCLPLVALPFLYRCTLTRMRRFLVDAGQGSDLSVHPVTHWLFRPFQGIGITLLFGAKLVTTLQLLAIDMAKPSLLLPEGHFQMTRFIVTMIVLALAAAFLGLLWTLDDMGVRYYNPRRRDLRTVGGYVGTLMPAVFGLWGIFGLLADYPFGQAMSYLGKIVMVLYPPFVIFSVVHVVLVRRNRDLPAVKTLLRKAKVTLEER